MSFSQTRKYHNQKQENDCQNENEKIGTSQKEEGSPEIKEKRMTVTTLPGLTEKLLGFF